MRCIIATPIFYSGVAVTVITACCAPAIRQSGSHHPPLALAPWVSPPLPEIFSIVLQSVQGRYRKYMYTPSVLLLSFVSFVSTLPSSVNLLFLLVHCSGNDAETTGRLSAGSPTISLQNSPSCDWSLDLVNKNKKNKKKCSSLLDPVARYQ